MCIRDRPKVSHTIRKSFRQTINQTLKTHLLPMADKQADEILQQYPQARAYLEKTLEQEAEEKIANNRQLLNAVKENIIAYNSAVSNINSCLQSMQLYNNLLPIIGDSFEPISKFANNELLVSDMV